jgi:glycosyltransferase involved in cell wall biosynthesis
VRVGYLLRYWPTLSETFVAREIDALRSMGTEVDVVALGTRADAVWAERSDAAVIRPPRGAAVFAGLPWLRRSELRGRNAWRAAWVAREGSRRGWARVHAHFAGESAEWALAIAEALGVPFSVTVHGVDLFKPRASLGLVLGAARPVVTVCAHHVAWLRERHGVDAVLVHTGLDHGGRPQADPGGEGSFVCVARDVPKKHLDALVPALPDGSRLRLVSDAHRLGGPRILAGLTVASAVPRVLARAAAFVLPCRVAADGDRDGLPVALLEAMAAGLPVVTTTVAGIPEVVDDTVGWLVPPDDPHALREAMHAAASSPAERVRRGAEAHARMRAWPSAADQARALLEAWHDAGR